VWIYVYVPAILGFPVYIMLVGALGQVFLQFSLGRALYHSAPTLFLASVILIAIPLAVELSFLCPAVAAKLVYQAFRGILAVVRWLRASVFR
jgi:hypothetical protein